MKRLELSVTGGPFKGARFPVKVGGLRFGRSSSNDLHISDEELSRNHCLFEISGERGLRLTDLASANGTRVNGVDIADKTVELKSGDVIEAGTVIIQVVDPEVAVTAAARSHSDVDLGLGAAPSPAAAPAAAPPKSPRKRSFALVAAVAAALAALVLLWLPNGSKTTAEVASVREEPLAAEKLLSFEYERVEADSAKVFRYALSYAEDGVLGMTLDDFPGDASEGRHSEKTKALGAAARAQLQELFSDPDFTALAREYAGPEGEPPELHGVTLRMIFDRHVQEVRSCNVVPPAALRAVIDRLEAFSKNELGVWAVGKSRSELLAYAAESAETAATKWADREVEYGNLARAIAAWREALYYLETVNPQPPEAADYREALGRAVLELDDRFRERSFRIDRAVNLGDLETARSELRILLEMIPDREDRRNREAAAKLLDVEKRIRKGGGAK